MSGTKLDFLVKENYVTMANEDEEYMMKEYIENALEINGYNKYEISNYAKPGFESKHNINYWKQNEYIGFGVAASSFISGTRYSNIRNVEDYIKHYLEKNSNICIKTIEEQMNMLSLMKEYMILNLRLKEGVNLLSFKQRFKVEPYNIFKNEIDKLEKEGLIQKNNISISLTKRGFEVANIALQEFI